MNSGRGSSSLAVTIVGTIVKSVMIMGVILLDRCLGRLDFSDLYRDINTDGMNTL